MNIERLVTTKTGSVGKLSDLEGRGGAGRKHVQKQLTHRPDGGLAAASREDFHLERGRAGRLLRSAFPACSLLWMLPQMAKPLGFGGSRRGSWRSGGDVLGAVADQGGAVGVNGTQGIL